MQQFDVICPTVSDLITAQIIEAPRRRARILANFGAGVDHIDCAAARRAGLSLPTRPMSRRRRNSPSCLS
jgi:lactate dehydrogenase-like 2-hydroxyacid dehydrogenase